MENLKKYSFVTLAPMFLVLFLYIYGFIGSILFSVLFLIYTFLYRPFFDKKRLIGLGLYNNEGYWKLFWVSRFKHYGPLVFGTE